MIFYFITWHDEPVDLARFLAAAYDERNYYFISVGGDRRGRDIDALLHLADRPNVTLHHWGPIAWGGSRFLENGLAGIRRFLEMDDRLQYFFFLTHDSFPLLSQERIIAQLDGRAENWIGRGEAPSRPPDIAGFEAFQHSVYRDCRVELVGSPGAPSYSGPGFPDGLWLSNFSFSDRVENYQTAHKGTRQRFDIGPYSAIGLAPPTARSIIDFVEMPEAGGTLTRFHTPMKQRFIEHMLRKHPIFSGPPFWLMSRDFCRYLMTEELPLEVFGAMAFGHCPELAYFSTVIAHSPFQDTHVNRAPVWYPPRTLTGSDIEEATASGALFARKVVRGQSLGFLEHFVQSIRREKEVETPLTGAAVESPVAAVAPRHMPDLVDVTAPGSWRLRDALDRQLAEVVFHPDGTCGGEAAANHHHCTWRHTPDGLVVFGGQGQPMATYSRLSVAQGRAILVARQVIGISSTMGFFLDKPLEELGGPPADGPAAFFEPAALAAQAPGLRCSTGPFPHAVVLDQRYGEPGELSPFLTRWTARVEAVSGGTDGMPVLRLSDGAGDPAGWYRLERAVHAGGRISLVLRPADAPPPGDNPPQQQRLDAAVLGRVSWRVRCAGSGDGQRLRLHPDGRVVAEAGETGLWTIRNGKVIVLGCGLWSLAEFSTFVMDGRWTLVGYGQRDLRSDETLHLCEEEEV